jgi:hypothetical protein
MLTQILHAAKLEKQRPLPFTYKILNEGLYGTAISPATTSSPQAAIPLASISAGLKKTCFPSHPLLSLCGIP